LDSLSNRVGNNQIRIGFGAVCWRFLSIPTQKNNMKYFELTKEEEKLLKEIEAGNLVPVKNSQKTKKEIILAAKNTLDKNRNINIRLSERVLSRLKAKAA